MQAFGNVTSEPVGRESKTAKTGDWEFRVGERQRAAEVSMSWSTVRVMKGIDPGAWPRATSSE